MPHSGGYSITTASEAVSAEQTITCGHRQRGQHTKKIITGYDQGNLLTNTNTYSITNTTKPAYLGSYVDPIFFTTVTRITGDPGVTIPTVGGTWSNDTRTGYSNRPVWNADQSLMVIERTAQNSPGTAGWGGTGTGVTGWLLLDGNTYAPLQATAAWPTGSIDLLWHPTIPALMNWCGAGTAGHATFGTWNPVTGASVTLFDVTGYSGATVGGTGNWSLDGNMVAVNATRTSDSKSVIFAVDLVRGTKYPDIDIVAKGFLNATAIDWVSISPLGGLIYANGELTAGTNQNDNVIIFDLQGNIISTWLEYGVPSHADLTVNVAGAEVAVGVVKSTTQGVTAGVAGMREFKTGTLTAVTTGAFVDGASTRCYGMKGWAIIDATEVGSPAYPNDEVLAAKLDSSLTVARLGQSHITYSDYETQGFVVPSPDGMRIAFSSDWNAAADPSGGYRRPISTYVIDLRNNLDAY